MCDLLEARPEIVACDKHPGYNTTAVAHEMDLPVIEVQHHYAHIASCLAENNRTDKVIGVSFDGTGYGDDGTIWGGEFLICDLDGYDRAGSIEPFLQLGGDAAAREGWRIAVSMIYGLAGDKAEAEDIIRKLELCSDQEMKVQFMMADRKINSVMSTSAGRLFDAVSAVLGIRRSSTFEGEASTTLQFRAESWNEAPGSVPEDLKPVTLQGDDGRLVFATGSLFRWIMEERLNGRSPEELAWIFHQALADGIVKMCIELRDRTGVSTAALSGGVFQNRLLLRMCEAGLKKENFEVLRHSMVPPNDGGICLGQAAVAARILYREKEH